MFKLRILPASSTHSSIYDGPFSFMIALVSVLGYFRGNKVQWENVFIASELSRKDHWPIKDKIKRSCESDTNVSYTFFVFLIRLLLPKVMAVAHSVVLTNASTSRALALPEIATIGTVASTNLWSKVADLGTVGSHKIVSNFSICRRAILCSFIVEWREYWRGSKSFS